MWIAGLVLIALAGGLYWGSVAKRRQLAVMAATETATAAFLQEMDRSVSDMGEGSLAFYTEVAGRAVTEEPLTSELAGVECVHYAMRVRRQYEEEYFTTDNEGRRTRRTRTGYETVAENTRAVPFEVEDATGRTAVDPSGADFIAQQVLSRFERGEHRSGGQLSLGGLTFDFTSSFGRDRQTVGYRLEEEAVPLGHEVYVIGEANDRTGRVQIARPSDGKRFLISTKSEATLARECRTMATVLFWGAVVAAVVGAGLTVAGIAG